MDASRGSEVGVGSRATSRRTSSTESDRWEVEDAAEQALQAFNDLVGLGLRPLEVSIAVSLFCDADGTWHYITVAEGEAWLELLERRLA